MSSVTASWWPGSCRSVTGGWLRSRRDLSKSWHPTLVGGSGLTNCELVPGGVSIGLPPGRRFMSSVAASYWPASCQPLGTTPAGRPNRAIGVLTTVSDHPSPCCRTVPTPPSTIWVVRVTGSPAASATSTPTSSVLTPDKHGDRWLISGFDRSEARIAEFASPHAFERYCLWWALQTTLGSAHDLPDCGGRHRWLGVVAARGRPCGHDCRRLGREADHRDGLLGPAGRFARGRRPREGGLQGARQRANLRDAAGCPRPSKGGRGEEHRGPAD